MEKRYSISSLSVCKAGDEQFMIFSLSDTNIIKYVMNWGGQEKYPKGEPVTIFRNEQGRLKYLQIRGIKLRAESLDKIHAEKIVPSEQSKNIFYRDENKKLWVVKHPKEKTWQLSYIYLRRAIDDNRFCKLPLVLQHRLEMLQKFVPDFEEKFQRREIEGCLQGLRIAEYLEKCGTEEFPTEKELRKIISPRANPLFSFAIAEGLRLSDFWGKSARPFDDVKLLKSEPLMHHPMAGDWDQQVADMEKILSEYLEDIE